MRWPYQKSEPAALGSWIRIVRQHFIQADAFGAAQLRRQVPMVKFRQHREDGGLNLGWKCLRSPEQSKSRAAALREHVAIVRFVRWDTQPSPPPEPEPPSSLAGALRA
jgi:hypothetical protein